MLRKNLSILLAIILVSSVFMSFPVAVFADNTATSGDYTYSINEDGTATINKYYGSEPEFSIPSVLDGFKVTHIGAGAFEDCNFLKKIVIPDSVVAIGRDAFRSCDYLWSISIPDSIIYVGGYAFYQTRWYNFQSDGPVYIGKAFYDYKGSCPSYVTLNEGTTCISDQAFYYEESLWGITIPASVEYIGVGVFDYCSVTIYGYTNSEAEKYAIENDIEFVSIGVKPIEKLLLGDADGNGDIESVDATLIQRICAEIEAFINENTFTLADVDNSGDLDVTDATFIQRYLNFILTPYKIGEPIT